MNVDSPATWLQLLQWDPFVKLAPAVISTMLLMLVMARFKSPLALPGVLVFLPGIFFVVLACLHKSLADAQDGGWVAKPAVGTSSTLCWCICVTDSMYKGGITSACHSVMLQSIRTRVAFWYISVYSGAPAACVAHSWLVIASEIGLQVCPPTCIHILP